MPEDLKLNMNAYLPLRDVVFQTLREAILKGDLRPGERLMELRSPLSWESAGHRSVKRSGCWSRKDWRLQSRVKARRLRK